MKTDKLNRKTDNLLELHGDSGFAILDKNTGEISDIPFGTKLNLPPLKYCIDTIVNFLNRKNKAEVFTKMYDRVKCDVIDSLSYRDYAWFSKITMYQSKGTNILVNKKTDTYLKIKDISKLLDINYGNLKTAFRNFESAELVKKLAITSQKDVSKTVNVYVVNPFVSFNGKDLSGQVFDIFRDTKWAKYY